MQKARPHGVREKDENFLRSPNPCVSVLERTDILAVVLAACY